MRGSTTLPRLLVSAANVAIVASCLAILACGSSTNTYTSPSGVPKCAVTFEAPGSTVPAIGGTGSIVVKTARECQWSAQPDAPWLSVTSGSSGQGDGTVQFGAAANPDPVARTGGIMLNGQRAAITQAAAECRFELASAAASFPSSGGSGTVNVRASSALCAWTATSGVDWITIGSGANRGSAAVTFSVAPTSGPPRAATITVAGVPFSVSQAEQCTYAISPDVQDIPATGGAGTVSIATAGGCAWTASSNAPWITVTAGATGSGAGAMNFSVAATNGPARSGTLTIAGRTFTVSQGQGCTFSLLPASASVPSAASNGAVEMQAANGCGWSAASNVPWLTITAGATGNGNATIRYSVAANNGPPRSGTITAGGQPFTVTQEVGCSYAISTGTLRVGSGGATTLANVTAPAGCSWSAVSNAGWIGISSGNNGSGDGAVQLVVAANSGGQRQGTVTIAGQTLTVIQAPSCNAVVSPDTIGAPAAGGPQPVSITIPAECSWTAASNASWIGIAPGTGGTGSASVQLDVQPNIGPARTGTATIAGKTVTVNQNAGCTFSIAPSSQAVPIESGSGSVTVTTAAGCTWTATSNNPDWLTITSGANGSETGTVRFTVSANATGSVRTGTLTIAGQTFTVNQAGPEGLNGAHESPRANALPR